LHLPVQSGSNRILQLMRRGYSVEEYKDKVRQLRDIRPDISLGSDFIVGFPGESESDFADTLALVEDTKFDHSFSFIYSPRPNTHAATLPDNVPVKEKKNRLLTLQKLLNEQTLFISKAMLNTHQKILVVGNAAKNPDQLSGRTENNRVVNFVGPVNLIGKIVDVVITEVLPNSLRGIKPGTDNLL
jgi:tRNA-2-methylthio-N6-dimethylallyladenosine synthase